MVEVLALELQDDAYGAIFSGRGPEDFRALVNFSCLQFALF
jgi:hypothetical protein